MSNGTHDEVMLGAYALDLLDPEQTDRASEHLVECGSCRTEYEQLIAARQSLGCIPSGWLVHGPPPGTAALEAAMRTIRAQKAPGRAGSRRGFTLAASIAGLAGTFSTGLLLGYQIQPAAAPPPPAATSSPLAGIRQASTVDQMANISMSVTVTPAIGWVRVRATVTGIPFGQLCRLIVVRDDGTREVAGSWFTSRKGETEPVVLDGSAAVADYEMGAILVENTAGKTFIAVQF